MKGVMEAGAASRIEVVEKLFASLGGSLTSLFWTFGEADFVVIGELPDNAAAAAAAMRNPSSPVRHVVTRCSVPPPPSAC